MRFPKRVLFMVVAVASAYAQTQFYGAIDLGSKGAKAELFSFHKSTCPKGVGNKEPNEDICEVYGSVVNTKLVSSMKDGQFSESGIQEAADAAKREMEEMRAAAKKYQLENVNYLILGSSGVAKSKNKDALVASVKAATGIDMDFIDAKREGFFGLKWAITDKEFRATSLYIDIGSGNTKLGCLVGGSEIADYRSAEIEYGSVSGRNKGREKNPSNVKAGIDQLMHEEIGPAYDKASMDAPCLRNRQKIYWTGGAAWATATLTHPEKALKGAVRISRNDIDTFLAHLSDGTWNERRLQYSFPKDATRKTQQEIHAAAEADKQKVLDTFVREDLLSGVSIMKTVVDSSNRSASIVFVRDSNFLFGYVQDKFPEHPVDERAVAKGPAKNP